MPIEEENIKGLLSKWGLASKPCDSCNSSSALLFCRPHSAFLCSACDANLHSNSGDLHARVLICEVCEQAPAAFTCKADAASLCSSCDRDIHSANPLARRHHRLPVVPFFNSPPDLSGNVVVQPPSVDESWLIPNLQGKLVAADFLYSSDDVDSFVDSGSLNFSVVPSQTKTDHLNRFSIDNCFEIDFSAQCISQSISSSDVGIVPDGNSNSMSEVSDFAFSKPVDAKPVQLSRIDRAARVMRYREKRKNRKFQKTIRYASRKAYAEARPRIKGRFVKRENADAEFDQIYGSAVAGGGFLVDDDLYGVVPSF